MPQTNEIRQTRESLIPLFKGKEEKFILPSGREVMVRETNGDDEDILSSIASSLDDGANILNFLSSIVENDSETSSKPTPHEIDLWPINDKYGLLLKQRVFVHGTKLSFSSTCPEDNCKQEDVYIQDLAEWDTDLGKTNPKNSKQLRLYNMGNTKEVEFSISSGKKLKYKILNGVLEKNALALKDTSKNSPLIIRELEIYNQAGYVRIFHFGGFSSKEMMEIRANVKLNDTQFDPMVFWKCSNPKCQKQYSASLFQIGAFFYPEEQI